MATMGVLHGYYVAEYRMICRDGARGTLNPLCLLAASEQSCQKAGGGLVDGDDVGCCMANMFPNIALFAELGQWGDTQPTLLGGC